MCSNDLREHYPSLVEVLEQTKRVDRRFQTQLQKVTKKSTQARFAHAVKKKEKSAARQQAGKTKAVALAAWRKDFRDARQALKDEGYKGSLKLKKGLPMHTKIVELQKARAAAASAPSGVYGKPSSTSVADATRCEVRLERPGGTILFLR